MAKHILISPTSEKSINVWDENSHPEAWDVIGGTLATSHVDRAAELYFGKVPWVWRAARMIGTNVGSMPFQLINIASGDVVDDSMDYKNALGWLPYPERTFALMAIARQMTGRAYFFRKHNAFNFTKGIRYLVPSSIEPLYFEDGEQAGMLRAFERTFTRNGHREKKEVSIESILFSWYTDIYVENEPPINYPAKTALHAAGVLSNVDEFLEAFFARGAIKATILTVGSTTAKPERDRLEDFWNRWLAGGIRNAFRSKVINADTVKPVVIGEGLEGLEDSDLSEKKREDIAAAFGIPQTRLFSGSAGGMGGGGVVESDDADFYNDTLIPETQEVYRAFNEQTLEADGLRLVINRKAIDVFQEDEKERSFSLVNLTASLANDPEAALVGMDLLGYEFPEGVRERIEDMASEKEEAREVAVQQSQQVPAEEDDKLRLQASDMKTVTPSEVIIKFQKANAEISQWQRHALRIGAQKSSTEFKPGDLSEDMAGYISGVLTELKDDKAIKALFANARVLLENGTYLPPALAGAVSGALEKSAPGIVFEEVGGWRYP